jgi:hypothetical protein
MKYSILGFVFATLLSANGSWAVTTYWDGSDLLKHCTSESTFEIGICGGYLTGTADTLETVEVWTEPMGEACIPSNATISQLIKVVVKHMQEHPENLHFTATSLVLTGLREAFPCDE